MTLSKSPWRRIVASVLAMLVVLLLAASYRYSAAHGIFAAVLDKPAACRTVPGVAAVTAISTGPQGIIVAGRDGLFAYANGAVSKLAGTPADFHPVAISAAGANLQVVFRRGNGSPAIAMFALAPGKLSEIGRLSADVLTDPADIVSVDGERFYLVNRHATHSTFGRWLDDAFLVPRAEVLYFDGMKFVKVAERLNSPAGLALSADGSHLYVAQELPRALASFSRSEFIGSLDHPALFALDAAPTKLSLGKDGSLIVAAWVKRGVGAVYRVRLANGVPQTSELLWSSKTESVAAAAEVNRRLLIGTEKRLIDCPQ